LPSLLDGSIVTFVVSVVALMLGILEGLALFFGRRSRIKVINFTAAVYISLVRGTPLLVQIFFVYYVLPAVGVNVPPIQAGIIALSLNSGAFVTEVIRGGVSAIPRGQVDAGRAVGMSSFLLWRRIIFPQVFVLILPSLTNELTNLIKASSLLSIITVVELIRKTEDILNFTFRPVEVLISAALLYFIMCFGFSNIAKALEHRTALRRA
jgi:polar amino acid transport system permease protein